MIRFDKYLASVLDRAGVEARREGADAVEAQHLLLAIAASEEPTTRQLLASVGLDHQAIREALDQEFARSLGAAGVARLMVDLVSTREARGDPPQLGTSAKAAMQRGFGSVTRKQGPRPAHLLLGIVQARAGTVPRALAVSGVDQVALAERIQDALVRDGEGAPT